MWKTPRSSLIIWMYDSLALLSTTMCTSEVQKSANKYIFNFQAYQYLLKWTK
jgi:hypothetical protein